MHPVRLSKVAGLPVVDTRIARQAGVVSDVLLDVAAGRVAVLNVQHSDGWLVQRIPAAYVHRLGPRTVLVAETTSVDLGPLRVDGRWLPTAALVGLEVMSERGERVGRIADAELDEQTLAVRGYVLRGLLAGWRRRGRVNPADVLSVSPELMLVKAPEGSPRR